jgi:pyrroline-5-carboxylate reductase
LPEKTKLIRIMPNTCALVQESASALCGNEFVSEKDMETAVRIFSAIGEAVVVPEEFMDGITALSGSGPAYVALFVEALIDAGVKVGLPRNLAEKLAIQTVLGTAKLLKEKKNPYQVKAMVTSPGGTTIAALKALYEKGMPGSVMEAVERAYKRSLELKAY